MPFANQPMTDRERFLAIMNYRPFDRGFLQDFRAWDEVADIWHEYGLPASVTVDETVWSAFWGFDRFWDSLNCQPLLHPELETVVLADEGDTVVVRDNDGVTVRRHKVASSIPTHLDHLLKDRETWERHFRWRLDGTRQERLWPDMEARLLAHKDRDYILSVYAGSLFGILRNWMGLEAVSYVQYDDPKLFAEMVQTLGDSIVGTLEQVLAVADRVGVRYDLANMWEDMSYSHGPLISPRKFTEHLLPQYKRITQVLRDHGLSLVLLDSDGDVSQLLPLWLEAGVNIAFPLEIGTWGADPCRVRREFGRECGSAAASTSTSWPRARTTSPARSNGWPRWWRRAGSSRSATISCRRT